MWLERSGCTPVQGARVWLVGVGVASHVSRRRAGPNERREDAGRERGASCGDGARSTARGPGYAVAQPLLARELGSDMATWCNKEQKTVTQ
jgi:hypothetical protein